MSQLQIDLYDKDTETEASVFVEYSTQPAEPEVGIPCAYGELEYVSMWIPAFGSVIFNLNQNFNDEVEQAMDDEIFEDECSGGYRG